MQGGEKQQAYESRRKQKEARLVIVSELYSKGKSFREIRSEVIRRLDLGSYSLKTVHDDIERSSNSGGLKGSIRRIKRLLSFSSAIGSIMRRPGSSGIDLERIATGPIRNAKESLSVKRGEKGILITRPILLP